MGKWSWRGEGGGWRGGGWQVIFKPLANSLPIHLCLGSVPRTSSQTKEALHQHSGKTDSFSKGLPHKTFSAAFGKRFLFLF